MPQIDPRLVLTGSDGEMYAPEGDYLGDVTECTVTESVTNISHRPMGSKRELRIMDMTGITITFTRTRLTDALLRRWVEARNAGRTLEIDFVCKLTRPSDGATHRSVFHQCVPDGDINLFSYRPGEIISDPWTFYVNGEHDLQDVLG